MPTTIVPPASLVSTAFLLIGQTVAVSTHHSRAEKPYPRLQRAHQNTVENIVMVYMMTGVLAVRHPLLAESALDAWVVGRITYTLGYLTGKPDNRNNIVPGVFSVSEIFTLVFGSVYTAYELVVDGV
ncbi:hypothetical protein FB451DRAFT_1565734 [Mycena latifolia]|nr:hypothetical protein FB451DRAFT_1565734 [Mycena latifolia]